MSYDMAFDEPWRAPRFVESNPLGLDDSDAQSVAQRLDIIQCTFWVLYHQYQKHHWLVEGPQFRDLHLFLEESYDQIYEDVDVVAERITALGAIPSTRPSTHETKSVVPSEPEGAYRIADSLRHDLRAEQILASDLRDVIELAIEKRDYGTKHMLEGMLAAGEDRAHHLDHFLGDDSLS